MSEMKIEPSDIVDFWKSAGAKAWFAKNDAFDATIRLRFEDQHHLAARGERDHWAQTPLGALALILLLDQFPRNIWRASAHAFATDPLARRFAQAAIAAGHDQTFSVDLRPFFYLPFMHSEDIADQDRSIELARGLAAAGGQDPKWALIHRDIIVRFGRFPHRNRALARTETEEEAAFLANGGFKA